MKKKLEEEEQERLHPKKVIEADDKENTVIEGEE